MIKRIKKAITMYKIRKEMKRRYEKMVDEILLGDGNPRKLIGLDSLQDNEYCPCGNYKVDESDFCKECI